MDLIPFSVTDLCLESYFIKITSRSKIIYWIIIGIIISGIAALPLISVDVSVQARGFFQSEIERQIVSTSFQGRVIYTSIQNGKRVEKGDTLLIFDAESIRAVQIALLQEIKENNSSIHDLDKLISCDSIDDIDIYDDLVTPRYQAELDNLRSQKTIQSQICQKKKSEHDRNQLLFDQQIITKVDYENSIFSLNSERDNLRRILLYQESIWQNDLTIRKNEISKLLADLEQYKESLSHRIILSPANGEIIQSSDIQIGSIVNQGQKIAEITPEGNLIATAFVKPADIGLIHKGQKVRIQVDAFNHNEWGMLNGEIIDISDDMIVENGSYAYFRIRCKPEKTILSLKNGHKAMIKKGMSINTRIFVIRRSLFNLLFDTADKWFNPYTFISE